MDFREAAEDVKSRRNDRKTPTIDQTRNALEELGNPDENYRIVLVGGTNGKGSTTEMISRMLQSRGFSVGKFTSPHLVTLRERIEVDGEMIEREAFLDLYRDISGFDLSFFEFMTVAAYTYFSRENVDYAIMEVGMGGRLDATNAVENSTAVITNVGTDHSHYLGDTREQIAEEKAGIIPENGLLIDNSDMDVFTEKAGERDTDMVKTIDLEGEKRFRYEDQEFDIPLEGDFQRENLETALTAVSELEGVPKDIGGSLETVSCPGRMEKIDENPETLMDGAHNPEALEKTVKQFEEGFHCVFGAMRTKDIEAMLEILERKASKIYLTRPDYRLAEEPEKIAEKASVKTEVIRSPSEAFEKARDSDDQVVVTGSLYLIGDLKKHLEQQKSED